MRVSCSSPIDEHSQNLIQRIELLGLKPIVTPILVRAIYDGCDKQLGKKLIDLFKHEANYDIYIDPYSIDAAEL